MGFFCCVEKQQNHEDLQILLFSVLWLYVVCSVSEHWTVVEWILRTHQT